MKTIPEYNRSPVPYSGCTEGWAREFDPIVEQLVSQAIGRQCFCGREDIRGKNITEISIEEVSTIIAGVMLRVLLYTGWRDLLNIKSAVADVLDKPAPAPSACTAPETPVEFHTKNQHDTVRCSPQTDAVPQYQSADTPFPNGTRRTDGLEDVLRKFVCEVLQEYIQPVNAFDCHRPVV